MCQDVFVLMLCCAWSQYSLQMWCLCCMAMLIFICFCWFNVWDATTLMCAVSSSDLSAFGFKLSLGSKKEMELRGGGGGGGCVGGMLSLLVG